MYQPSFASEFPHDNPALSAGATWFCDTPCAPPSAHTQGQLFRPAKEPATPSAVGGQPSAVRLVEAPTLRESAPNQPAKARAAAPAAVSAPVLPETAFERFVNAMVRAALEAGATRVAAELPTLLGEARLCAAHFDADAQRALRKAGYLNADGSASPRFVNTARAWQSVLCESSPDFGACGEKTLDEWAAALLAALLGAAPTAADTLRKRLRADGVAAFGMRDAA